MSEDKDIMFNKAFCDGKEVNIEVESDKDIDVEFQGVLGDIELKTEIKNYRKTVPNYSVNADYSVSGFKKLTDSHDGFTPIDEAMEEIGFLDDDDEEDVVNNPSHYNMGDIEVITYIEQQAKVMSESGVPPEIIPHICNAIKYLSRFQSKGKPTEDLNKSIFYIQRSIDKLEKGE